MLALSPPELLELLKTLPPDRTAFVWGPPGIGKSALVRAAGDELGLPCVVLLGTQIAPEDLIGVPRIREVSDGRFATEFCPPGAILRSNPFLLFVDELNSAVPDVQKAFYSLILDRRLGDYELPAGSRVVAAGNRIEDRALVRPMATALATRMVHVGLEPNADAWLAWAAGAGVHPLVLAFVRARPDRLCEPAPNDGTPAYPTPRAWHMLSDAIAATSPRLWPALASGSVGDRAGAEFGAFAQRAQGAPTLEAVAHGQDRKSTRLNSSHLGISYAVFCLKKKNNNRRYLDHGVKGEQEGLDISGVVRRGLGEDGEAPGSTLARDTVHRLREPGEQDVIVRW